MYKRWYRVITEGCLRYTKIEIALSFCLMRLRQQYQKCAYCRWVATGLGWIYWWLHCPHPLGMKSTLWINIYMHVHVCIVCTHVCTAMNFLVRATSFLVVAWHFWWILPPARTSWLSKVAWNGKLFWSDLCPRVEVLSYYVIHLIIYYTKHLKGFILLCLCYHLTTKMV